MSFTKRGSPKSKLHSKSASRCNARHRTITRQRLEARQGADRAISPLVVDFCLDRHAQAGITLSVNGVRELFYILQRVLHTTHDGASLPLSSLSSPTLGRKILNGLLRVRLIRCVDPDSWKPRDFDFRNAKARCFLPSSELLLANIGLETVSSAADYRSHVYGRREIRESSDVILNPASQIFLSDHTIETLQRGTGLQFNLNRAVSILKTEEESRRSLLLQSGFAAVGRTGAKVEIQTCWKQHKGGRLYASEPAIVNLPTPLRRALEPVDRGIRCEVDYVNFELRILHAEAGLQAPEGDIATTLGEQIGHRREQVKAVINPWMHGQTLGNLVGTGDCEKLQTRIELEKLLRRTTPALCDVIDDLRDDKYRLQRRGAEVFFTAFETALRNENVPAGIPLHDGWIFPAKDKSQLLRVKAIFENMGQEMLSQPMPVKGVILN